VGPETSEGRGEHERKKKKKKKRKSKCSQPSIFSLEPIAKIIIREKEGKKGSGSSETFCNGRGSSEKVEEKTEVHRRLRNFPNILHSFPNWKKKKKESLLVHTQKESERGGEEKRKKGVIEAQVLSSTAVHREKESTELLEKREKGKRG